MLISDGGANVGITDVDLIAENAAYAGSDGIYLVGVGVGTSNYNDELMDDVTDAGKGASVFINDADEAWKIFNQNFVNTMSVAARDVRVELDMPPGFEIVKFSGEEFGTDPTEIEPQHLSPNDTMVFLQDIETCAPETVSDESEMTVRVTYQHVTDYETDLIEQTYTFGELLTGDRALLLKGAAIVAYTDALVGLQQYDQGLLAPAMQAVQQAQQANEGDQDLAEIAQILTALGA